MKLLRFFILLLILLPTTLMHAAQNDSINRKLFFYRLSYQPDSTTDQKYQENFLLQVTGTKSLFTDLVNRKADSMEVAIREYQRKYKPSVYSFKGIPKPKFTYYVEKDLAKHEVSVFDKIGAKHFKVVDNRNLGWKLQNERRKIQGFNCQKATINLYGREWIAWFNHEIPINDGPYKFYNLPGFIVEISDSKNYYSFQLIKHSDTDKYLYQTQIPEYRMRKIVSTDKVSFYNGKASYEASTVERLKNSMLGEALTQERIKQIRDRLKNNNNPLEMKPE